MKKSKLNIEEVIKNLRSVGWTINKGPNNKYQVYFTRDYQFPEVEIYDYTERELYRLYKLQYVKGRRYKKFVKKASGGLDRTCARGLISHEKFDDIPSQKPTKKVDPWSYD